MLLKFNSFVTQPFPTPCLDPSLRITQTAQVFIKYVILCELGVKWAIFIYLQSFPCLNLFVIPLMAATKPVAATIPNTANTHCRWEVTEATETDLTWTEGSWLKIVSQNHAPLPPVSLVAIQRNEKKSVGWKIVNKWFNQMRKERKEKITVHIEYPLSNP